MCVTLIKGSAKPAKAWQRQASPAHLVFAVIDQGMLPNLHHRRCNGTD